MSYTNKIKHNKNLMIVAYKLKESLARSKRDITVYDEVNAEEWLFVGTLIHGDQQVAGKSYNTSSSIENELETICTCRRAIEKKRRTEVQ